MHDRYKAFPVCLSFNATSIIPARSERFAAVDHFKEDVTAKAKVKISHLGVGFRVRFLEDGGLIEEPTPSLALCSHKLLTESIDSEIIGTLGGEEQTKSSLSAIFALLEKQATGRSGDLTINNHLKNIFYVPDRHNVLCTILVSWYHPGWFIGAVDLTHVHENRNRWGLENHVFTRATNRVPAFGQCISLM